jgi:succinoglycan biosynthesis protein ExoW
MIGVVIPYFQRAPGLLNRALRSVAAQARAPELRVYIVDDASPSPPEADLVGLPPPFAADIVILRQPNRGPGEARNRALDNLPDAVRAIAFLDSDDAWSEGHLASAGAALAAGAEFYFADHQREEDPDTRFSQCGYHPDGPVVPGTDGRTYWCDPESVSRAIIRRSPVGTSTVVLRRDTIGSTRFPPSFRAAGEDSIFWLEVLARGAQSACGLRSEAAYGRGVSVFNNRGWGDAASLRTTLDEMRAQHHIRAHFPLDRDLRAQSRTQCERLDLSFCANLIACSRRGQWTAAAPALSYVRQRPWALMRMPYALARAVRQATKAPA